MTMSSAVTMICVVASVARGQHNTTFRAGSGDGNPPISFFLYLSSILATRKISFKMGFFFAFLGLCGSTNQDESESMAAASNLSMVSTPSAWTLGDRASGWMTILSMYFKM